MVINTASKIGYNNDLRRAGPQMRLGENDNVNVEIKQTGIPKHNFVPSKNKLPHAIETETKNINVSTHNTHNIKTSSLINSASGCFNNFSGGFSMALDSITGARF